MRADPDLAWFFQDAATELGLRAMAFGDSGVSGPSQRWPSVAACRAAARQRKIAEALKQLSAQLQSVLECAYVARYISVDKRHEYDLAAPLIERALLARHKSSTAEEKRHFEDFAKAAPVILETAHAAFRIVYGPRVTGRVARRRASVARFVREEGISISDAQPSLA